jgi:hypothetical protein
VTDYRCEFEAELWRSESSDAAWYFVSLPADAADDIAEIHGGQTGGFGSVRVEVTVDTSTWRTSIFPDSKRRTFVLPVKKAVRAAEGIDAGSPVHVLLRTLRVA